MPKKKDQDSTLIDSSLVVRETHDSQERTQAELSDEATAESPELRKARKSTIAKHFEEGSEAPK